MTRLMRIGIILTIATLLLAASTTAWAQRDPFNPLVHPESQPAAGEPADTQPAPAAPQEPEGPRLPRTGTDALPYLLLAAAFITVGGAFIRIDRWVTAPV